MTDFEQLFSPPENRGEITISGQPEKLFRCKVCIMDEIKSFWRADHRGLSIVTACDSMQECITKARKYLKKQQKKGEEYGEKQDLERNPRQPF